MECIYPPVSPIRGFLGDAQVNGIRALETSSDKLILRPELTEDCAFVQADGFGNFLDAGRSDAAPVEQAGGYSKKLFTLGGGYGCAIEQVDGGGRFRDRAG